MKQWINNGCHFYINNYLKCPIWWLINITVIIILNIKDII